MPSVGHRRARKSDDEPLAAELAELLNPKVYDQEDVGAHSGMYGARAEDPEDLDSVLKAVIGKTGARLVAKALYDRAIEGNLQAIIYIFDRLKGRPRQQQEIRHTTEHPLALLMNEVFNDQPKLPGGKRTKALPQPRQEVDVREGASEETWAEIP